MDMEIMLQMEFVLKLVINGINIVQTNLIVKASKLVPIIMILFVKLTDVHMDMEIIVNMEELVLIHGINDVQQELIVTIKNVPVLIILFVKLTNVHLDMEIMVQMEHVLLNNGIHYVHPELIVTIINVPVLIILFV